MAVGMTAHMLETRIPKLFAALPSQSRHALISLIYVHLHHLLASQTHPSAPLKAQIFLLGCSRLCAPTLPPCPLQIPQPILHMVLSTPLISKSSSSSSLRKSEDDNNNNPELFLFFLPSFPPQELWGDCPAVIRSSLMQQIFPILRTLFCGAMRSRWMDVLGGCQGFISM